MKKILIIGGSRFIGPALVNLINTEDRMITVFNRGNDYGQQLPINIVKIKGDRRDPSTMQILANEKYDLVYDLCCFNKTDALNLLNILQPTANIVFLSTAAVYKKPSLFPIEENSELGEWDSFGDYGTCKAQAEKEFIQFVRRYNLKLTIFRPVYLLGKDNYFDRENYYFSRILNDDPILIPSNGNALIQFAFLEETVRAFAVVPQKQVSQIEVLNVGGDQFVSLVSFVKLCANVARKEAKLVYLDCNAHGLIEDHFYDDFYPFPNLTFIVNNSRIKQVFNFNFQSLESGMQDIFVDWKHKWNGKTKKYPHEIKFLKKINENI